jgi:hypothetical protein
MHRHEVARDIVAAYAGARDEWSPRACVTLVAVVILEDVE